MSRWICRFLIGLIALGSLFGGLLAGCSERQESRAPGEMPTTVPTTQVSEQQVTIDNFSFDPPVLTVPRGTRVTWLNRDDVPHTVTSSDSPARFNSKAMDTDEKFSHVFTQPGTYPYFCAVHPMMTAKIVVN